MNTIGRTNSDSWAQFMKLTQEARVRNNGLSGAKSTTAVKSTGFNLIQPAQKQQVMSSTSYRAMEPGSKSSIVGGKFDAYA